jgi:hypothetical protein
LKNNSRTTAFATAATLITAGAIGVTSASTAAADESSDVSSHGLGAQATLTNGDVVQGWTVSDLKPSADTISYPVQGTLWEATATDVAINGTVIPIVSNLNARTPSGQIYRVLYQVATPQGVNPATLAQGQKTTGKVYFDVTGDKPNGVVYNSGDRDLASWVQSQKPQRRSGSPATSPAVVNSPAKPPAVAGGPGTPPAALAPGMPPVANGPGMPPAVGSAGAPPGMPPAANGAGMPGSAGAPPEMSPVAGSAGAPPAGMPPVAGGAGAPPGMPPAAGGAGMPGSAGAPPEMPPVAGGQEAPANGPGMPPVAGSAGAPPAGMPPVAGGAGAPPGMPPAAGSAGAPPAVGSAGAPPVAGSPGTPPAALAPGVPPAAGDQGTSAGSSQGTSTP